MFFTVILLTTGIFSLQATRPLVPGQFIPISVTQGGFSEQKDLSLQFAVLTDIRSASGDLIIAAGSPVQATVTSKKRRGVGKPGNIVISFNSVLNTEGEMIMLGGNHVIQGEKRKGEVLGVGLGAAAVAGPAALFYMFKKGGSAVVQNGSVLNATVANDRGMVD